MKSDPVLDELIKRRNRLILALIIGLLGYGLLIWIDWRIALAMYAIAYARNLGDKK